MPIQTLPRTAVRASLTLTRLPLSAAELVLAGGREDWPPRLAFDGFEATVKRVVGGLLRDDVLVREGDLEATKVDRLRDATELETLAEQQRAKADSELQDRREADRRRHAAASAAEAKRTETIEREAATAKRHTQTKARAAERSVREAEAERKAAADRKARRTRKATLTAEQKALAKEQAAATRARAAQSADKRLARSKAARTNGS